MNLPNSGKTVTWDLQKLFGNATSVGDLVHVLGTCLEQHELFYGHGTDNAHDEAYALVFSALGLDFTDAEALWNKSFNHDRLTEIINLVRLRIEQQIPLPYLTGEAWFAGLRFHIDRRALIPRSPFAELITNRFMPWIDLKRPINVLDMGTGSGCMGIATAIYLPQASVDLVDISAQALQLTQANVALHDVTNQVEIIQSNLFEQLHDRKYDLIISNPPYVPASSMGKLPVEYTHEPVMALQADDGGMEIVDHLLSDSLYHLHEGGILIVEVGEIESTIDKRYAELPFTWLNFENGGQGVFLLHKEDLV